MKFSIKYFFSKFDQIRRKPVALVTFTEEIFNKKLHFLCSGGYLGEKISIIEVWQDAKYNPCTYYHTSHWVEHVIWTSHIRLINALFLEGKLPFQKFQFSVLLTTNHFHLPAFVVTLYINLFKSNSFS